MGTTKQNSKKPDRRLPRRMLAIGLHAYRGLRHRRTWLLGMALAAVTIYGAYFVWQRLRDDVFLHPDYQVELSEIDITPLPAWIRTNLKAEALRDGSLDPPLSIVDEDLLKKVAKAFAFHPWVAEVKQVRKRYPAHLDIDLVYRQPVAMIEVPGGLFPVDAAATLLPSADFTPLEARDYPRVTGIGSQPLGPVGTAWGDKAVSGAAQIAIHCAPVWKSLQLQSIRWVNAAAKPDPPSKAASGTINHAPTATGLSLGPNNPVDASYYELVTKNGTAIPWGAAPGDLRAIGSGSNEPDAAVKISRLQKYFAEHGGLDEAARRRDLDLRRADGTTRTATRDD